MTPASQPWLSSAVTGDTKHGVNTVSRPTQYKSGLDYDTSFQPQRVGGARHVQAPAGH